MILLIANDNDTETIEVCRWLNFYNEPYQIENSIFDILSLDFSRYKSIWNRGYTIDLNLLPKSDLFSNKNQLERFYLKEIETSLTSVYHSQNKIKKLGDILKLDLNKLQVLDSAELVGLNVPKSYIVTKKSQLETLIKQYSCIISKPFSNIESFITTTNEIYIPYTQLFSEEDLKSVPESFFPSLVQEYIKPLFEVKGLFLIDEIYSISIKCKTGNTYSDSKILLNDSMNSEVSDYKLPIFVIKKITKLFNKLNLKMGTFDLIVNEKLEHSFLEINPSGKFDKIAEIVNLNIYKNIANYLK